MDRYHHGNLREVLVGLARESLNAPDSTSDFPGLSLRDLARKAGVSPTAVYHHFPSKDALLVEVARITLQELATRLESVPVMEQGTAYLEFFLRQPVMLDLIFGPRMREVRVIQELQDRAFQAMAGQLPPALPGEDPGAAALFIWALVHGLSQLYRLGALGEGARDCPDSPPLWLRPPPELMKVFKPLLDRALALPSGVPPPTEAPETP